MALDDGTAKDAYQVVGERSSLARRHHMVAKKGASQEGVDDLDVGRRSKSKSSESERGCYGQALREGQVRRPPPGASRIVNTLLWVLNVVGWLLLMAFMAWRIHIAYFVENM
jgi:hypothetical protein